MPCEICPASKRPCGYREGNEKIVWCALLDAPVEQDTRCPADFYDPPAEDAEDEELPF